MPRPYRGHCPTCNVTAEGDDVALYRFMRDHRECRERAQKHRLGLALMALTAGVAAAVWLTRGAWA